MNKLFEAISGVGILIAIFLFLNNYKATTSIISTMSTNAISGIKTLQGR